MKYVKPAAAAAIGLSMISTSAMAGGMAEPMMEPEVVVEESTGSSGGFIVPLLLLAVIVAVASGSDGGEEILTETPL